MVCIYCSAKTRISNSRRQLRSNNVWRRRNCTRCGAIFSTSEQVDYEKSIVVQSTDGRLSPFLRDKLFASIYRSCQHRPSCLTDTVGLTATVTARVWRLSQHGKLESIVLARTTLEVLTRFDRAAAVSYAAFHSDTASS